MRDNSARPRPVPAPTKTGRPFPSGRAFALLSVAASVLTIALKLGAYFLTGSVGLLSDAMESFINLAAALVAVWALTIATRPPDNEHAFGHSKAEYFASGIEGLLILVAAAGIGWAAWNRLLHPQPLENIGLGLTISVVAAGVNGATAIVLLRAGKRLGSITLYADALHLLTDVWTSGGVLVGVALVKVTGWLPLDPLIAAAVAVNIIWTAVRILRDTAKGVLDTAIPQHDRDLIDGVLSRYQDQSVVFHALRTRLAGQRRFVDLHVLVPGSWSVQRGHTLCEEIEAGIASALPRSTVFTHLEPLEDSVSWTHGDLDRPANGAGESPAQ